MSQNCKPTPWVHFDEWCAVRRMLFPPPPHHHHHHPHLVQRGIDRVAVWACRGRAPLAALVTAQLLRLRAADAARALDPQVVRLGYAMAVVRLVNGVVEPEQRARGTASSVADIAERCGMPRWFVDVRHDATHTSLPSLATLRLAAETALGWLRARYWEGQAARLADEPQRVGALLDEYDRASRRRLGRRQRHSQMPTGGEKGGKRKRRGGGGGGGGGGDNNENDDDAGAATTGAAKKRKKKKKRKIAAAAATAAAEEPDAADVPDDDDDAQQRLIQQCMQTVGPQSIRDVVIPALLCPPAAAAAAAAAPPVAATEGHGGEEIATPTAGMLLPERFSKPAMRILRARWEPFLTALQHAWPFFTGALCATVAESILDPPAQAILAGCSGDSNSSSSSSGKASGDSDGSMSLQWWLDALLAQLLRGKPSRTARYRISAGDGARLAACVADPRSRHAFGRGATMSRLLELCKRAKELDQRAAKGGVASMCSARGEAQEGADALEGRDAVALFELDTEMAALRGDAANVGGGGGSSSSEAPSAAARTGASVSQRMMSLEELELSMAGAENEEDEEEEGDEGEEEVADDSGEAPPRTDKSGAAHVSTGHDGWAVCEDWQPCPVGHLPGQSLLVGAGLGDLKEVLDQRAVTAAAAHAAAARPPAAPGLSAPTLSTSIVFG